MPIHIKGLDKVAKELQSFEFVGPKIETRFLTLIAELSIEALRMNVPVDTGRLRDSFSYTVRKGQVDVYTTEGDLLNWIDKGTPAHVIEPVTTNVLRFEINGREIFAKRVNHPGTKRNPIIDEINSNINNMILKVLEQSMSENHPYFAKLPGGKGRKYQQVGRTSAGFRGGVSFSGRSTINRPGMGGKRFGRRLQLKRRRGRSINPSRKEVKLG